MERVSAVAFGVFLATFFVLLLAVLTVRVSNFDGAEIAGACRDNRGVQQVVPTTWTSPADSRAVIVCKDGDVAVLR